MSRRIQFSLPDLLTAVVTAAVCGALSIPMLRDRVFSDFPEHPQLTSIPILLSVLVAGLATMVIAKRYSDCRPWKRWLWFFDVTALICAISCFLCYRTSESVIGHNEWATVSFCIHFAKSQEVYYRTDIDGDGVHEYARSLQELSAALPWEMSAADAAAEVVSGKIPKPHRGYLFKILTTCDEWHDDKMSRKSYIINGKMTNGYALLAYPAEYGVTGMDCYLISNKGSMYSNDLGPDTEAKVKAINSFSPSGWNGCIGGG